MNSQNILACNLGSYGRYRAGAAEHLQSIGVRYVEIPVPADEAAAATMEEFARFGLGISTLQLPCDLSSDETVAAMQPRLRVAQGMGVAVAFVSAKQGDAAKVDAFARLRRMAELAAQHGVTLAVETHPEFAHNAAAALETMRMVDHPNLRLNFDTGNIYYYNRGTDAVAQLRQIIPFVASVHLKDSGGGYHAWDFPALGDGVVDFPTVFRLLNESGFYGPFTMELEGIQGEQLDEEEQRARVARSVEYLRARRLVA
jgi:L-ribulose-5-phosphate 3-epimerase